MKIRLGVTLGCGLLLLLVLSSCSDYNDYKNPTSQYGTGTYQCFYQNVQTGTLYKADMDDKQRSLEVAQHECLTALGDMRARARCQPMDCVFR